MVMILTSKTNRFKIKTFFDESMQERSIRVLDRQLGKTFIYYEDEVDIINNRHLLPLKHYLKKRMHFIRSGAYD